MPSGDNELWDRGHARQPGDNAVQLHAKPFASGDPTGRGTSSYLHLRAIKARGHFRPNGPR
jgi:hypothetical protein